MMQSVDLSSRCELLGYLIDPVGIERHMPLDLRNGRIRILVRPHRIDGLLSSSGNAVVIAIALVRTVRSVIGPFQLRKIDIFTRNVLNGRIVRFPKRHGVAGIGNRMPRNGHDNASGIPLDRNRMIRAWNSNLFFFHVSPPFLLGAYFMIVRSSEKKYSDFFGSVNLSSSCLMTLRYDGELAKALKPSISSNHSSTIPSVWPKFGPAGRSPVMKH